MVKNGENAKLRRVPLGSNSRCTKNPGKKEIKKPPEKGTGYLIRI
jgi:hypothetical protein